MKREFSEHELAALRASALEGLSEYRARHIREVEVMIRRLGGIYLADRISELSAAALLHDFTKELSPSEHERILASHGILLSDEDRLSPKLYHAVTAALLLPERYPDFATEEIVSAVRYHTTGRRNMTLFEMLLYLADYIDGSRTFNDCVALRSFFFSKDLSAATPHEKLSHLYETLIRSVDYTVKALVDEGAPISPDSINLRNDLIARLRSL